MENLDVGSILGDDSLTQVKLKSINNVTKSDIQKRRTTTKKGAPPPLSREAIQPYLQGTLSDASKDLGVSPSKLKRICRHLGIQNWQQERDKAGYPKLKRSKKKEILDGVPSLLRSCSSDSAVVYNSTDKPSSSGQERETMIVKASYNEDIVRFGFPITGSINLLKEELGKKLDLQMGAFKMKYMDDELEWVLLTCESDLEECISLNKFDGRVRLCIQNIPGNTT